MPYVIFVSFVPSGINIPLVESINDAATEWQWRNQLKRTDQICIRHAYPKHTHTHTCTPPPPHAHTHPQKKEIIFAC